MSPDELSAGYAAQRFGGESDTSTPAPTPLYDLGELLERPELLRPPPVIVPRLAYEGRLVMLAAAEKVGKSTLLGQAVAANVEGTEFLGEAPATCPVLWLALDEPVGDLVRRLARHGLKGGVSIYADRPSFVELEETVTSLDAGLVVIDTMLEFASGFVEDPNSAMQWQPVLKSLRGIAQRTGAGIVGLHHVNRSTGRYRDSSQLGAGVDQIVEMTEVENDPALRKCRVRGRISSETFTIRYVGGRYELEGAELPLEMRVYRGIESNPGIGLTKLRKAVGGKGKSVDDAVRDLLARGAIEDRGGDGTHAYYTKPVNVAAGPGLSISIDGQAGTDAGQGWGQAPVPTPCPAPSENHVRDRANSVRVSDGGQQGTGLGQATGQPHPVPTPYKGGSGTGVVGGSEIPLCSLCGTAQKRTIHNTYRCPKCCPDNRWAA